MLEDFAATSRFMAFLEQDDYFPYCSFTNVSEFMTAFSLLEEFSPAELVVLVGLLLAGAMTKQDDVV